MKVILLQNVPKIGLKGDLKDLKEGYVRNMLLPRKLAKIANISEINNLEKSKQLKEAAQENRAKQIADSFKSLEGKVVCIKEKANEKGHLFAKIDKKEILEAFHAQVGQELEPEYLIIENPIKEIGKYEINLRFEKLKGKFTLVVESK